MRAFIGAILSLFVCATVALNPEIVKTVERASQHSPKYVVVCDAGSSGTRGYTFYLETRNGREEIIELDGLQVNPGLSSFEDKIDRAGPYLESVIKSTLDFIPDEHRENTFVFVLATAGMRSLASGVQNKIYDSVYNHFAFNESGRQILGKSILRREFLATITGQVEGFFGMLAVNYLKGRIGAIGHFDHDAKKMTVSATDMKYWPKFPLRNAEGTQEPAEGSLDLGGKSTQILYDPLPAEKVLQNPADVYVHSFLGLGSNAFREKFNLFTLGSDGSATPRVSEPVETGCYYQGLEMDPFQQGSSSLKGTGDAESCRENIRAVLAKEKPQGCDGCTFDGEYLPEMAGNFVAMALYFFATDCIRSLFLTFETNVSFQDFLGPSASLPHIQEVVANFEARWPSPTIAELREAADVFCSFKWSAITKHWFGSVHKLTSDEKLKTRCFEINFIIELLTFGYGLKEDERRITFASKINNQGVEWALGAFMVFNSMVITVVDKGEHELAALRGNTYVMDSLVEQQHPSSPVGSYQFFLVFVFLVVCVIALKQFSSDPRLRWFRRFKSVSRSPSPVAIDYERIRRNGGGKRKTSEGHNAEDLV